MPSFTKIDGKWRESWVEYAKVNNVWRMCNKSLKVNGVWRDVYRYELTADDILGFRIVYVLNKNKKYPLLPHLKFNPRLPIEVELTGATIGSMDMENKGVILRYEHDLQSEEGIIAFDGRLYAELTSGTLIDVGLITDDTDEDRLKVETSYIDEAWTTNRLRNICIQLNGYVFYDSYGYNLCGFNNLFNKDNFLFEENTQGPRKDLRLTTDYIILPFDRRDSSYSSIASIGIARSVSTAEHNMLGAHGIIDHTITSVYINGTKKPFTVELYRS